MQDIPLTSSLIARAQYDDEVQTLVITFKSGARWSYGNTARPFTPQDAAALEGASSPGRHFLDAIKGAWPERRL